ncbi:DNA polymerase III subunit alpha, partial [Candidatus Dojkabacteria bacterium]|nr:DNA polymerase III subunit alpha [Candidatus Dojkabacteria bacterium]
KYSEGIIATTGCMGSPMNQALINGNKKKAEEWLKFLKKNYEDVYIEIMRFDYEPQKKLEKMQLEMAEKLNIPIIATVDSHYIDPEDHRIQEIAWCISDGTRLNDPKRRQYVAKDFWVKTPEEMVDLFKDLPEAVENTMKVADSVEEYKINYDRIQPKYDEVPKGKTTREYLLERTLEGAKNRYGKITKEIRERIDYELEIIHNKGYDDYFLVVEDYCNWAREQGILVGPGRGSGAGSVAAYALKITNIDPYAYDLIFERFLNPERPSPPDFDIDFQDDRRDELFQYMSDRYGHDNTAFIGTFGRLKTKAAIRDVARVMGIDLGIADKLSKMVIVKFGRVHTIDMMLEQVSEFKEIIESDPRLQELAGYVRKLENIARHTSTHACGYLVTPTETTDYVPLQKEGKGGDRMMTQFEGGPLEYLGLMKFDFLGLSNLTIIQNTIKQIKYTLGEELDIDEIPMDDEKTFELFQDGNTTGVFQFESDGMKKYLRDLKPTEIEDLIFMNAAYRPGPMKYIPDYIERKFGRQEPTYPHEDLVPILKKTYGFAIYQEQVIRIAVEIAGYSLGESDILRRAMGKKKPEVMEAEKEKFLKKAQEQGYSKKLAQDIFAYLEPFADYGFNKSHSACYSVIAYQTAYLKANYPIQFLAGLMETDLGNADKVTRDLKEAREMEIDVLPPHVNESFVDFKIEPGKKFEDGKERIRFGMGAIKGVSNKIVKNIVEEREENGNFSSLDDLIERVGSGKLTKKVLELLIQVGAMDEWGNRNQLLVTMPQIFDRVSSHEAKLKGGQDSLFGGLDAEEIEKTTTTLPDIEAEDDQQRIAWEKDLLGTFLSQHPLTKYRKLLVNGKIKSISDASKFQEREKVMVLSIISEKKVIFTKKDNRPMAFLQLDDGDDKVDGVVFPSTYERVRDALVENMPMVLSSSVSMRDDTFSLIVDDIAPADALPDEDEMTIDITGIKDKEEIAQIKQVLKESPGNEMRLKILYGAPYAKKTLEKTISPTPDALKFLQKYSLRLS